MKLSTKIAYNAIAQISSKGINTIISLLALAMVTRYLGQAGFGQYTIATTFASFFAVLADLGLTLVTVQLISQPGANRPKLLNNLLSVRLLSAAVLLLFAPMAALFFPYSGVIKISIALYAFSLLFVSLNQILVGLFQQELKMDKVAIAEIFSRIIYLGVIFLVVRLDFGLIGIIVANIFSGLASFLVHYLYSRPFFRWKLEIDRAVWREIFSRSWPLALTIALNLIYLRADTLILSIFKSESELGIYGAAYRVIDVLTTVPFMFAGLVLPILSLSWAQGNKEYFLKIYQRSFDLMAIIALPMAVGVLFTGREIMALIAGRQFTISGSALSILIFAVSFIFIGCIPAHVLIAINRQRVAIKAYLFVSVTSLIGYFILIPRYSYYGAAAITVYSEAAIALYSIWAARRYSELFPSLKPLAKSLVATLVMAGSLMIIPYDKISLPGRLIIEIATSMSVYFAVLYSIGGLTRDDFKILTKS
jgi:O-antigen/teichoic acid export membrane protein